MATSNFCKRVVTWLRDSKQLSTRVLPGDVLERNKYDGHVVRGFFVRASSAGNWAYVSFCLFVLAATLFTTRLPGLSPQSRNAMQTVGQASCVGAIGSLVVAESKRRGNRTPALIEIREAATPPTQDSISELHRQANGAETWLISEASCESELAAQARALGMMYIEFGSQQNRDA